MRDWLSQIERFLAIRWLFGPRFYDKPDFLELPDGVGWDDTHPFGGEAVAALPLVATCTPPHIREWKLEIDVGSGAMRVPMQYVAGDVFLVSDPIPAGTRVVGFGIDLGLREAP